MVRRLTAIAIALLAGACLAAGGRNVPRRGWPSTSISPWRAIGRKYSQCQSGGRSVPGSGPGSARSRVADNPAKGAAVTTSVRLSVRPSQPFRSSSFIIPAFCTVPAGRAGGVPDHSSAARRSGRIRPPPEGLLAIAAAVAGRGECHRHGALWLRSRLPIPPTTRAVRAVRTGAAAARAAAPRARGAAGAGAVAATAWRVDPVHCQPPMAFLTRM